MCSKKNCYFCKNLCFLDAESIKEYFCTMSCDTYENTNLKQECQYFSEDLEE